MCRIFRKVRYGMDEREGGGTLWVMREMWRDGGFELKRRDD